MRYRAFLSYSHADRYAARRLHRALESYRPPRSARSEDDRGGSAPLAPIFRDRDELPSSSNLSDAVNEALRSSDALIVICSPKSATSRWVNEEIRSFRALGKADRIYCYIIDGEPGSGGESECFPAALLAPDPATGKAPEPVAADARKQGDGRHFAMLKIAAALLGVGFDALRQRDLRRGRRRLIGVAAGSLVIAGITLVLAVSSIVARNEAERRRAQSEELIHFMLIELQEQLYETGRTDLTIDIAEKAEAYFSSLDGIDVDDHSLSRKALSLRQTGEALIEQGQLASALPALFESLLIMERLSDRNADDDEMQIGLANSYFYVGNVHWLRGDMDQAKIYFETVLPIVDAVTQRAPDNADWLLERGYAYTNLGRVLELEGSLHEAQRVYHEVMKTNQRLQELEPDNPEWNLEVGFAHNNLGKLSFALGHLDQAQAHYLADLAVKERVFQTDSSNNYWREYVAASRYFIGQLLSATGNLEDAEEHLLNALQELEFLTSINQEAAFWIARRANVERELAIVYSSLEKPALRNSHVKNSIALLDELSRSDSTNAAWRRDLARSLTLAADFARRNGQFADSGLYLRQAGEIIDKLVTQEPENRETRRLAAEAELLNAQLIMNTDSTAALAIATEVVATLDTHFTDSSDPRVLELKSLALSLLGQTAESANIRAQLTSMGYASRRVP